MKFKTESLRAAVASALKTYEQNHHDRCERDRNAFLEAAADHATRFNAQWESALPKLRKAIREGQPITKKMLPMDPRMTYDRLAVFDKAVPKPTPYEPSPDLVVVGNALRLVEDEYITMTQLRTLGCSAAMLRTVFELARDEQLKQERATTKRTTVAAPTKPKVTRRRGAGGAAVLTAVGETS